MGVFCINHVYAVDEEYFIPYTDNYGYEYDVETGTYIKRDAPSPTASGTQESIDSSEHNINIAQKPESVSIQILTTNQKTSDSPLLIFAGVVLILGFSVFLTRAYRKKN